MLLVTTILLLSLLAMAHEFWLLPQKFFFTIREVALIRFRVGENFTGENWKGTRNKVHQLEHFTPSGKINDLSNGLSQNPGDSIRVPLQEEGTHMIIFNSTNTFIELEPEKFNDYLKEDGLDATAAYRKQKKEDTKKGTEFYQRSVKTLLQVGGTLSNACTQPTSLPLDIIPVQNPYAIPNPYQTGPAFVMFRILFKNEPLPNALVKIWQQDKSKGVQMQTRRTNRRGMISIERIPGPVMVSCVHMEPAQKDSGADWQSYWASLSFEYSLFFTKKQ